MARRLAREEGILLGRLGGAQRRARARPRTRAGRSRRARSSPSCATPASATCPSSSTTPGCRRTRCSTRRGRTVQELLERRPPSAPAVVSVAPAAAVRQALNLMSTWGVSQIPVLDNGQSVGGLIEGTLMARALAQPALLDRPVSEVMEPPFPEVEAGTADGPGRRDAHAREPGGAGAQGRQARRHREPVRRAAAVDRDEVGRGGSDDQPARR